MSEQKLFIFIHVLFMFPSDSCSVIRSLNHHQKKKKRFSLLFVYVLYLLEHS